MTQAIIQCINNLNKNVSHKENFSMSESIHFLIVKRCHSIFHTPRTISLLIGSVTNHLKAELIRFLHKRNITTSAGFKCVWHSMLENWDVPAGFHWTQNESVPQSVHWNHSVSDYVLYCNRTVSLPDITFGIQYNSN